MTWQDRTMQEVFEASLRSGHEAADHLAAGGSPAAFPLPFRAQRGEQGYAWADGTVYQWLEGDSSYLHQSFFSFSPVQLAVGAAAAAIGNAHRRNRAARAGAATWRPVWQGRITMTNHRFVIQGDEWIDLWHDSVNLAQCDGYSVELHPSGIPPLRLVVPAAHWWWVVLHEVAWSQRVRPPAMSSQAVDPRGISRR